MQLLGRKIRNLAFAWMGNIGIGGFLFMRKLEVRCVQRFLFVEDRLVCVEDGWFVRKTR